MTREIDRNQLRQELQSFRVIVDYGMTFKKMISTGNYEHVDENIIEGNFPIQAEGIKKVVVELVNFERVVRTDEVLEALRQVGYRPIKIEELLALSAVYGKSLKKVLVVCLGSIWTNFFGDRYAVVLDWGNAEHCLRLVWCGDIWSEDYNFAVVKTKPPL